MSLLFLAACLGSGLNGEETDGIGPLDTSASSAGVEVSRWFASGSPDAVGEPHALILADNGALGIAVEHFGYEAPCTAAVGAEAYVEGATVQVVYSYEAPDTYSDTCAWTLDYVLSTGTGEWTVEADGDVATVTVEGGR